MGGVVERFRGQQPVLIDGPEPLTRSIDSMDAPDPVPQTSERL